MFIAITPLAKFVGSTHSGDVFYRITDNTTLLDRAKNDIKQSNLTQCDFNPSHLIIVTWENYFVGSSLMAVSIKEHIFSKFIIMLIIG